MNYSLSVAKKETPQSRIQRLLDDVREMIRRERSKIHQIKKSKRANQAQSVRRIQDTIKRLDQQRSRLLKQQQALRSRARNKTASNDNSLGASMQYTVDQLREALAATKKRKVKRKAPVKKQHNPKVKTKAKIKLKPRARKPILKPKGAAGLKGLKLTLKTLKDEKKKAKPAGRIKADLFETDYDGPTGYSTGPSSQFKTIDNDYSMFSPTEIDMLIEFETNRAEVQRLKSYKRKNKQLWKGLT